MSVLTAVLLLAPCGSLNAGEVAGFPAADAERMIAEGKAQAIEPAAEPKARKGRKGKDPEPNKDAASAAGGGDAAGDGAGDGASTLAGKGAPV
mgnify:CR=1 FL=1